MDHRAAFSAMLQGLRPFSMALTASIREASNMTARLGSVSSNLARVKRGLPQRAPGSPVIFPLIMDMVLRRLEPTWRARDLWWKLDDFSLSLDIRVEAPALTGVVAGVCEEGGREGGREGGGEMAFSVEWRIVRWCRPAGTCHHICWTQRVCWRGGGAARWEAVWKQPPTCHERETAFTESGIAFPLASFLQVGQIDRQMEVAASPLALRWDAVRVAANLRAEGVGNVVRAGRGEREGGESGARHGNA